MQVVPDKAMVAAAVAFLEVLLVWLVLKWLSVRGSAQKVFKTLCTTIKFPPAAL